MACVFVAASEAATQAMNAPRFTQGSALDAYMEATRSAKKGARAVKAAVPEPAIGASGQDSVSSAQESASSAISSLTEGEALSEKSAGPPALCILTHWMPIDPESSRALYLQIEGPLQLDDVQLLETEVLPLIGFCAVLWLPVILNYSRFGLSSCSRDASAMYALVIRSPCTSNANMI